LTQKKAGANCSDSFARTAKERDLITGTDSERLATSKNMLVLY